MVSWCACAPGEGDSSSPGAAGRDGNDCRSEGSRLDQRFPRSRRLTARRQFLSVYGHGARVHSASFTLFGLPNRLDACRLGLTVSRKVGAAHRRNRIKRLLREVFRVHRAELSPALDVVINAHPGAAERLKHDLEREFLNGMRRLAARLRA